MQKFEIWLITVTEAQFLRYKTRIWRYAHNAGLDVSIRQLRDTYDLRGRSVKTVFLGDDWWRCDFIRKLDYPIEDYLKSRNIQMRHMPADAEKIFQILAENGG